MGKDETIDVWVASHNGKVASFGAYRSTEGDAWGALIRATELQYETLVKNGWTVRPATLTLKGE